MTGDVDVAIVGAGPAGAAAALALARAGREVVLLERDRFPRWKVCGACVGPAARRCLDRLGVGIEPGAGRELGPDRAVGEAPELTRLELRAEGRTATVDLAGSIALSRAVLDARLVAAAEAAGARFRDRTAVRSIEERDGAVELELRHGGAGERLRARVVVDAAGLGGVGRAEQVVEPGARVGLGAVFGRTLGAAGGGRRGNDDRAAWPEPGTIRMCVGAQGYVGLVRAEDGSLIVAAALDRAALTRLGPAGAVDAVLAGAGVRGLGAPPDRGWRGTPPLTRRAVAAAEGRIFRAGDAAGYVEPFTGEGIGWALASGVDVAPYVVAAIESEPDAAALAWSARQRAAQAQRGRACRMLARGLRRSRWVGGALRVLGRAPGLAQPFVRMAAGR